MQVYQAEMEQLFTIKDSLEIVFYEGLIMLKVPFTQTVLKDKALKNDSILVSAESIQSQLVICKAYIYEVNKLFGLKYDSLNATLPALFNVDSVLVNRAYKGISIVGQEDSIVYSVFDKQSNMLIEKYVNKQPQDFTYQDSTILYYNTDLNKVPFSFSPKIDKEKEAKLFKIEAIFNEVSVLHEGKNYNIPRRLFVFDFKQVETQDKNEMVQLFERYKKESKSYLGK